MFYTFVGVQKLLIFVTEFARLNLCVFFLQRKKYERNVYKVYKFSKKKSKIHFQFLVARRMT